MHVHVCTLESLTWTSARTRAVFGTTPEGAAATRELAFDQGFDNLFLAVVAAVVVVVTTTGSTSVASALVLAATGSMLAAALVLLLSSRDRARGGRAGDVPAAGRDPGGRRSARLSSPAPTGQVRTSRRRW